jgi:dolichyl-phosphate-mannose--protein O-mannosyl transferase
MAVKKDAVILGLILFLAITTRAPFINYPKTVVFDERLTATFALRYLYHLPYFDVHPPLVSMIMAAVIKNSNPALNNLYTDKTNSFGDFPYTAARELSLLMGIILPVIIYLTAKKIYKDWFPALVSAMLVIFDNSLVLFSRLILSDIYLLTLGFTGLLLFMGENKKRYYAGAVFLGLAISVKWIALVFVLTSLVRLWQKNLKKEIIKVILIIAAVHLGVWLIFFGQMNGQGKKVFSIFEGWYPVIYYPAKNDPISIVKYLPGYFVNMFGANSVFYRNGNASPPMGWPLNIGQMLLDRRMGHSITLTGNYWGWWSVVFALLIYLIYFSVKKNKENNRTDYAGILILISGYGISFLPWFFIGRAVFIYHYLTPVVFGYLLVPGAMLIIENKYFKEKKKKYLARILFLIFLIAVFIFQSPVTYGFRVPEFWMKWLIN